MGGRRTLRMRPGAAPMRSAEVAAGHWGEVAKARGSWPPVPEGQKPRCLPGMADDASGRSSGLPDLLRPSRTVVQWRSGEQAFWRAYGGGSAPDSHGIPYQVQGHLKGHG